MVRALAFVVCAAAVGLYALRGGSFDVVPRAELGIAAWWIVAVGWAVGVLPRARIGRVGWLPAFGLLALAAWTALSLRWSESDERTAAELARVFHHSGLLVLALSLLCRDTWRAAVGGLLAGALVVCGLAVASRLWPDAFPADVVGASFGTGRLSYPLNYWNAVAAWGAMTVCATLALSAHASVLVRCLSLAALPVGVLATYLTYSRAGVVGTVLGLLVVWAFARHRAVVLVHAAVAGLGSAAAIMAVRAHPAIARAEGGAGQTEVLLALAVAAALGAATAWATWRLRGDTRWRLSPPVARRVAAVGGVAVIAVGALTLPPAVPRAVSAFKDRDAVVTTTDPSARLGSLSGQRFNSWSSAFASFEAAPVLGTGAGTFEFWWSREARDAEFVVDAHSLYLETLAELGLPGLLCVLVLCGGGLLVAVRARRGAESAADAGAATAVLAAFIVWLFHAGVDWMWESTATVAFALLLVAAAAASRSRPLTEPTDAASPAARGSRFSAAARAAFSTASPTPAHARSESSASASPASRAAATTPDATPRPAASATPASPTPAAATSASSPSATPASTPDGTPASSPVTATSDSSLAATPATATSDASRPATPAATTSASTPSATPASSPAATSAAATPDSPRPATSASSSSPKAAPSSPLDSPGQSAGLDRAAPSRVPYPRAAARALVVLVALIGVAVQLPALVGASSLRVSQAAAAANDDRRALGAARDASATLPWAASPHVQLALLAESTGDLRQAEREARQAVALEPTNWRHRVLLARVLAQRGDAQAALESFAAAERLRPLGRLFSS